MLHVSHPFLMSWCGAEMKVFDSSLSKLQAAAANSLQSCPTLCDPIDSSPPGSPVPGILQARMLEWVAISFSTQPHIQGYFNVIIIIKCLCSPVFEIFIQWNLNKWFKGLSLVSIPKHSQLKFNVQMFLNCVSRQKTFLCLIISQVDQWWIDITDTIYIVNVKYNNLTLLLHSFHVCFPNPNHSFSKCEKNTKDV